MSSSPLLKLTRDSMKEVLSAELIINKDEYKDEIFNEKIGLVVSIWLDNELRGSSGEIISDKSLFDGIVFHAKKAAFQDPMFSPLTTREFLHAQVELSLVTSIKKLNISSKSELATQLNFAQDGIFSVADGESYAMMPNQYNEVKTTLEFVELFEKHNKLNLDQVYSFTIDSAKDKAIIVEP